MRRGTLLPLRPRVLRCAAAHADVRRDLAQLKLTVRDALAPSRLSYRALALAAQQARQAWGTTVQKPLDPKELQKVGGVACHASCALWPRSPAAQPAERSP